MEIKDSRKFSIGMIFLMTSAVLFLFGEPLAVLGGIAGLHYLLGLLLLVGGTWLVERGTGGTWRQG